MSDFDESYFKHLSDNLGLALNVSNELASDLAQYLGRIVSSALHNSQIGGAFEPDVTEENALTLVRQFIQQIPETPQCIDQRRGIVICAGGYRYTKGAWITTNILRRLGCNLPIELWQTGARESDHRIETLFAPLGVAIRFPTAQSDSRSAVTLGGWQLKPYSILNSAFSDVLLLDADNVPVKNPEYLYSSDEYQLHGAMFWPDYARLGRERRIWTLCGVGFADEPEFESGQILVNKIRSWRALHLTMYLNLKGRFYYQYIHGDKDTYHMAWRMCEKPFYLIPFAPRRESGFSCQHAPDGTRLFQHCNLPRLLGQPWPPPRFRGREEWITLSQEFDQHWRLWHAVESVPSSS